MVFVVIFFVLFFVLLLTRFAFCSQSVRTAFLLLYFPMALALADWIRG